MGALSDHPGIVTLYDAGYTRDERPYLVMPYVAGGTLHDRIVNSGPMSWQDVTALGVRLSGALETAHRAGVLHRDIKPANVLCSDYGEQLSDFGIARIQGGHETRSGVITASVAHAAPEILDAKPPTAQADVYALASTLYEAVNGRAAFAGDHHEGLVPLIRRVLTEAPPDLRPGGVPDEVASVIEAAMAKDPRDRSAGAEEFGRALQRTQAALGIGVTELVIVGARPAGAGNDTDLSAGAGAAGVAGVEAAAPVDATTPPGDDDARSDGDVADATTAMPATDATTALAPSDAPTTALTSSPAPTTTQPAETILPIGSPPHGHESPSGTRKAALIAAALIGGIAVVAGLAVVLSGGDSDGSTAPSSVLPPAATTPATAPATTAPTDPATTLEASPETTVEPVDGGSDPEVQVGVVAPASVSPEPLVAALGTTFADSGVSITAGDAAVSIDDGLEALVAGGQNPIIAIAQEPGRAEAKTAVQTAAGAHPETTFVVLDAPVDATNVASYTFAEHEGGFLMGAIAALTSTTGRVGFLAAASDTSLQHEAGFVAGARHVEPGVQVDVRYIPGLGGNFDNVEAERALAESVYTAGADVIYHAATSGVGLFEAAASQPGRWAIGFDIDHAASAPDAVRGTVLTSMVKRYDVAAAAAVDAAIEDRLAGGTRQLGFVEGGIEWSRTGGALDARAAEIDAIRDSIASGEIIVPENEERRALAPLGASCPADGCQIRILSAEPIGSELQLILEANWTPSTQASHAHYYWSPQYTASQVGGDSTARFGVPVGAWDLDDRYPLYVTEGDVSLANRGSNTELCVTAADAGHNVLDPTLFDCISVAGLID